jgi:hypothetical protein
LAVAKKTYRLAETDRYLGVRTSSVNGLAVFDEIPDLKK